MLPFDNLVTTRLAAKDQFRPCIPKPVSGEAVLPAPAAYDRALGFEGLQTGALAEASAAFSRAATQFPRGEDAFPAAPSALYGIQPAPVGPPSVALGRMENLGKL